MFPKGIKSLLAGVFILSLFFFVGGCGEETDGEAEEGREKVPVETEMVEEKDIYKETEKAGITSGEKDLFVLPKTPGEVEQAAVEVGDKVSRGDLLIKLDEDDIIAQVKQAEASLAAAESDYKSAKLQHEDAKRTLERMERLYEEDAISEQEYEEAQLAVETIDPEGAKAMVEQAEAALEEAQRQLEHTAVTAPVAGEVVSVDAEEGEMVSPERPAARIVGDDIMKVKFDASESEVNRIDEGDSVEVSVEAAADESLEGVIHSISSAADERRAYPVEVRLEDTEHNIRPGMFAAVNLVLDRSEDVPAVPVNALLARDGEEGVFVVEDGYAVFKEVESGLEGEDYIEIISGLEEGEEVVIRGQHTLTEDTPVQEAGRGER